MGWGVGGKGRTGKGRVTNQGNTGEVRGDVGGKERERRFVEKRPLY